MLWRHKSDNYKAANDRNTEKQKSAYRMNTPLQPYRIGNSTLLSNRKTTAFLCSRQVPENKIPPIYNWINQLSPEKDCILCGNHSRMEQEVFNILLEKKIPVILALAEGMKKEWDNKVKLALEENRMLIVTTCDDKIHRINHQSAYDRNETILSLADDIIIGYCTPGGNIDRQTKGKTNITYLQKSEYLSTELIFTDKVADSDVMIYRTSTKKGKIFLDIKQESSGQEYLKITQSKPQGNSAFHRETIFIDKNEVLQFKEELEKVIDYWKISTIKKNQTPI